MTGNEMFVLVNKTDPALTTVSREVDFGQDRRDLIDDMFRIMATNTVKAIGLAANQVGVTERVIVVNCRGFRTEFINPEITKKRGGLKTSIEGCLSFPGVKVKRQRHNIIVVEGYEVDWNKIKYKVNGLIAFVVQHEIDHLNGITIANGD